MDLAFLADHFIPNQQIFSHYYSINWLLYHGFLCHSTEENLGFNFCNQMQVALLIYHAARGPSADSVRMSCTKQPSCHPRTELLWSCNQVSAPALGTYGIAIFNKLVIVFKVYHAGSMILMIVLARSAGFCIIMAKPT